MEERRNYNNGKEKDDYTLAEELERDQLKADCENTGRVNRAMENIKRDFIKLYKELEDEYIDNNNLIDIEMNAIHGFVRFLKSKA